MKVLVKAVLAITAIYLSACSSSSDSAPSTPPASANQISTLMTSVGKALETATASGSSAPGFVAASKVESSPFYLAAAITCTEGGFFEDHNDPDWASKQIYCLTRTKSNGPDTLLGAFAQATGFVCSVGSLTFDGVERAATMNFSTACFSQAFVDMVQQEFGGTSFSVDITAADISATHKLGAVTVNSAWTKSLQIKFNGAISAVAPGMTILVKDDAGAKAVAVHQALVLAGEQNGTEVFAVYVEPGVSGKVAYEGRFATPTTETFSRHLRLYLGGTIDATTLTASDVKDMAFVWGDGANMDDPTYASYASILGTPVAGRKVLSQWWNKNAGPAAWQNANGNNQCYGEGTPACTGNSGIGLGADKKFFFQGAYTSSYNWFINSSYLSHFDMDMTMEDIQQ
ncbi:hypothetical protein [Bdellovibrio bacteriovorus]|uniref:hypothetical protein n=1 Tax=Bdellovibrio bacteriovorus TaxID=959 RepID=UPI0035A580A2